MDVTLDKFGRVLIPKAIRDRLGLKAGTELILEIHDTGGGTSEIALRPVHERPVLEEQEGVLVYTGDVQGEVDVVEHLRRARNERIRTLAGRA